MARLTAPLLVLLGLCVAATTATLEVIQGRLSLFDIPHQVFIPVAGVATVELGGLSPPLYYFDCSTSENNGSGLVWSRDGAAQRFDFAYRPEDQVTRLDTAGLTHSDLGVYTCEDTLSRSAYRDSVSINITTANPAVCAVNEHVAAVQGQTVQLEVYASSFPMLGSGQLTWFWPNGSAISSSQAGTFDSGKRLVLSNIQPSEAGLYRCRATLPPSRPGGATLTDSDTIQLDVYAITLMAFQNGQSLSFTDHISVSGGQPLTLECHGSGNLLWSSSNGLGISTNPSDEFYQQPDILNGLQRLYFSNFTQEHSAIYSCQSDLTDLPIVVSVYVSVIRCEWCHNVSVITPTAPIPSIDTNRSGSCTISTALAVILTFLATAGVSVLILVAIYVHLKKTNKTSTQQSTDQPVAPLERQDVVYDEIREVGKVPDIAMEMESNKAYSTFN